MLGTQTRGGSMVGADESTELWRHPKLFHFCVSVILNVFVRVHTSSGTDKNALHRFASGKQPDRHHWKKIQWAIPGLLCFTFRLFNEFLQTADDDTYVFYLLVIVFSGKT